MQKEIDGLKVEGFWRAHQVPIAHPRENPAHLQLLRIIRCEAMCRKNCSIPQENLSLSCRRLRPKAIAAWAPIRMPMAVSSNAS